jgi:hypothetical protein
MLWDPNRLSGVPDLSLISDFQVATLRLYPKAVDGLPFVRAHDLFCVRCGGMRKVEIRVNVWPTDPTTPALHEASWNHGPSLFTMTCLQCGLDHVALVHDGPDGRELAIFSTARGGLSTPNAPDNVKYYLDQAHRAESVGAVSAAAGMYRSALEMLLYERGFEKGMLDAKIKDLLSAAPPPDWLVRVDSDYLELLKKIANGAMHPNDGDIAHQKVIDRDLLTELRAVFEELLDVIYEEPARKATRKAKLTNASQAFPAVGTKATTT